MGLDFRPLSKEEQRRLSAALRLNADSNGKEKVYMDPKDTTFCQVNRVAEHLDHGGEVTDEEVINAIASVPCHY